MSVEQALVGEAQKFAAELTKRVPGLWDELARLEKQKAEIESKRAEIETKLANAQSASSRYQAYEGRRGDGSFRCPKCWICDHVDSTAFGPTGSRESGREVYSCRCGFRFLY
jgi:hypothetical protein